MKVLAALMSCHVHPQSAWTKISLEHTEGPSCPFRMFHTDCYFLFRLWLWSRRIRLCLICIRMVTSSTNRSVSSQQALCPWKRDAAMASWTFAEGLDIHKCFLEGFHVVRRSDRCWAGLSKVADTCMVETPKEHHLW